ncbi:luciferin 4-monooxygenase [Ixodes scapularis]|uniref:luciferin 4-monooxygenase n=1 Tax=Ixodes scapularis TaxID=6945 RepID=UPI001A9CFFB9|nr:luciferin 4-monooxygenase [Ixodes scapularis]
MPVTTVAGNGTIMLALAKKIAYEHIGLDCVKKVLISGAKTEFETLKPLEPVFDLAIVKDIYGATETGEICRPPMDAVKWYGIGFPAPKVQIKIVDIKSGKVLGPNEKGEALVKSPYCMRGYYENPEATSNAITADGWVRTGDMCYYNEDGQFFFVERMNDLFKAMGILVAPSSIERVLLSHKGIEEAAVIGVPHPEYSQVAGAFVVLKTDSRNITEEELKNFVAGQLGVFMHLHGGVKFVQKMPKDDSGKVNKKELMMYRQGT